MKFKDLKNVAKPISMFLVIIISIYIIVAAISYISYSYVEVVSEDKEVFIPSGTTLSEQAAILYDNSVIKDTTEYLTYARKHNLENIYPGKYLFRKGFSYKRILRTVGTGSQIPVRITFNNIDDIEALSGRVSKQIELDSTQILSMFKNDTLLSKYDLKPDNALFVFIPNTYEAYWAITPDGLLSLMRKEYDKFWNNSERIEALSKLEMTSREVITLASIVDKECYHAREMPIVAGIYINRLNKGMRLQACPTVKYALGDRTLRRILHKHLLVDSPYNTYMHSGLPPTPISLPSIKAIDAVLNYTKSSYLFFCASDNMDNTHLFATTVSEHNVNAAKYAKALNKAGILK